MKYALIGCGRISPNHIEAAKNNTENEGIELKEVSEHSFIDNGQEGQDPVALTNDQAAELANVSDGAEIVVETTNGTSNISIDGQDVQLSEDLTNIIVDSAKDNVVQQSTTYSIGDTQVSEEDLSSLSQDAASLITWRMRISKIL